MWITAWKETSVIHSISLSETPMRSVLALILLTCTLCGCSRVAPPAPAAKNVRLPVEVEKGPEDALPKKWARPGGR